MGSVAPDRKQRCGVITCFWALIYAQVAEIPGRAGNGSICCSSTSTWPSKPGTGTRREGLLCVSRWEPVVWDNAVSTGNYLSHFRRASCLQIQDSTNRLPTTLRHIPLHIAEASFLSVVHHYTINILFCVRSIPLATMYVSDILQYV